MQKVTRVHSFAFHRNQAFRPLYWNTFWMLIRHCLSVQAATQSDNNVTRANWTPSLLPCLGFLLWLLSLILMAPNSFHTEQETLCTHFYRRVIRFSTLTDSNFYHALILSLLSFISLLGSFFQTEPSVPPWSFFSKVYDNITLSGLRVV